MSSEVESTTGDDEDFSYGLLLRDIEEISKALYVHKIPRKSFNSSNDHCPYVAAKTIISESKSNVMIEDSSHKDKKSSLWNWKPLKTLAHTRNHWFNCCFFLHVHAIEGLPPNFDNLNLCVTWKRKTDILRTRPAQVCSGMAEFQETLIHRCTVYCSRNGPHSSAKYESKVFLLHASIVEAPNLDIGNHWIDLSRLLPLKLEDLVGDSRSSGKWTTSFKLTGNAKGATLNVSFGFSIMGGDSFEPGYSGKVPVTVRDKKLNRSTDFDTNLGSFRRISTERSYSQPQTIGVKFLEDVLPNRGSELSHSVTLLYQKLDEAKKTNLSEFDVFDEHLDSLKPNSDPSPESTSRETGNFNDPEFDVNEQAVEVCMKDQVKVEKCESQRFDSSVIETIDFSEIFKGEETAFDDYVESNSKSDEISHFEHERLTLDPENQDNNTSTCMKDLDLDFCDMLASKREELDSLPDISKYREPENYIKTMSGYEAEMSTNSLSLDDVADSIENDFLKMLSIDKGGYDTVSGGTNQKVAFADGLDFSFAIQAVERNHRIVNQPLRSERDAKILEDLEAEALMHEWGLDEEAFQYSPRVSSGGFGSPVYVPAQEPLKLPCIEEGLGPIICTKDGGFLRSMNPLLFRSAYNGARLIVQVSAPVVLPPAMGFTIMEILQCWASRGVENMCIRANELMPLDDVTGKTIQQVMLEAESRSDTFKRWALQGESKVDLESDYVAFEDLVPLAITNIESLLIEGLKIQSGMANQEAPSSIRIHLAENSDSVDYFSSERDTSFQALNFDEFVKYSVSLKESMKLDSGSFCAEDENISAHYGGLGNNFIMGLKAQLRDPSRDYEMVGSSMLALIQVEKKIYKEENDGSDENMIQEGAKDSGQNQKKYYEPQFKVLEVHLAGLNGSKQLWGSSRQQQTGSRWLFSSGMAKSLKNLVSSSNAIVKYCSGSTRKGPPGDVLWSISSSSQGEATTWNDQTALNVHVRNPDIIFPNESVK